MKKLILHIGTEKTGTSTIQKFLGLNRTELMHQGFRVPLSTRENNFGENQRWFPALFYPSEFSDDFITNEFGDNANLRRKRILNKLEEFKNEIVKTNEKNYIISSEHLSSRLKDVKSIATLKTEMLALFDDIEVILYIRNPINHAISQISTEAKSGRDIISQFKNGGEINFLNPIKFSKVFNIRALIEKWELVFSRDKIKVNIFDVNQFLENDLLKDFCKSCGISLSDKFKIPIKENDSLNLTQFRYICYFNNKIPKNIDRKSKESWIISRKIIKNLKYITSEKLLPTEIEVDKFEDHFAEDKNWIKKNFFNGKKNIWTVYDKRFRKEDDLEKLFNFNDYEMTFLNAICAL